MAKKSATAAGHDRRRNVLASSSRSPNIFTSWRNQCGSKFTMLDPPFRYPVTPEAIPSFGEAFRHYLLPEFRPAKPILSRSDYIITQGSCFAGNLADALGKLGIRANWLQLIEAMNSPLANRTYLEYALTDKDFTCANHAKALSMPAMRALKNDFMQASAFVFTAGLAYVKTGGNGEYWLVSFDGEAYGWRLTGVAENREHIEAVIALVRSVNPTIKIVLSVSPNSHESQSCTASIRFCRRLSFKKHPPGGRRRSHGFRNPPRLLLAILRGDPLARISCRTGLRRGRYGLSPYRRILPARDHERFRGLLLQARVARSQLEAIGWL